MLNIRNKKITVVGAQRSGLAAVKLVKELGGLPRLTDVKPETAVDTKIATELKALDIPIEWGGHTPAFMDSSDLLVLSPGVRIEAEIIQWAKKKKIPVLGEIEFAYQFCAKPVIAVTGSNGKTTVSTLIAEVLEANGRKACLCGNIGSPFSSFVLDLDPVDFVVLEVSSFQMESLIEESVPSDPDHDAGTVGLKKFKPHIAVLLNFSQNHLDRHKDLDEYFDAKTRIFMNQDDGDFAVLNFSDQKIQKLAEGLKATVWLFGGRFQEISDQDPNHQAVMAVADILNLDRGACLNVLREFKGVEHRLEWVATIKGVKYINDSKATTAEAGRWALTTIQAPLYMICGGRDKNIDFCVLRDIVPGKVMKMFVIGEASDKLIQTFKDIINVEPCQTLQEAVLKGKENAREGDVVVLSPMCASFDMFENFEHRGKVFKEIVFDLRNNAKEINPVPQS